MSYPSRLPGLQLPMTPHQYVHKLPPKAFLSCRPHPQPGPCGVKVSTIAFRLSSCFSLMVPFEPGSISPMFRPILSDCQQGRFLLLCGKLYHANNNRRMLASRKRAFLRVKSHAIYSSYTSKPLGDPSPVHGVCGSLRVVLSLQLLF